MKYNTKAITKEYITYALTNKYIPNINSMYVYLIDVKNYDEKKAREITSQGEIKRGIYYYTYDEIFKRLSKGGRNSQVFHSLLKDMDNSMYNDTNKVNITLTIEEGDRSIKGEKRKPNNTKSI